MGVFEESGITEPTESRAQALVRPVVGIAAQTVFVKVGCAVSIVISVAVVEENDALDGIGGADCAIKGKLFENSAHGGPRHSPDPR